MLYRGVGICQTAIAKLDILDDDLPIRGAIIFGLVRGVFGYKVVDKRVKIEALCSLVDTRIGELSHHTLDVNDLVKQLPKANLGV